MAEMRAPYGLIRDVLDDNKVEESSFVASQIERRLDHYGFKIVPKEDGDAGNVYQDD